MREGAGVDRLVDVVGRDGRGALGQRLQRPQPAPHQPHAGERHQRRAQHHRAQQRPGQAFEQPGVLRDVHADLHRQVGVEVAVLPGHDDGAPQPAALRRRRGLEQRLAGVGDRQGHVVLHREEVVELVPQKDEVAAFLGLLEQVLDEHRLLVERIALLGAEAPGGHEVDGQADDAQAGQRLRGEPEREPALY
ncbi:hypothetical protein D9M69_515740 [compost metagenome]